MYKTLLVDDEVSILNGMAAGIPWEKWGYQVVGMAKDGLDAVEMIEAFYPDVVVSDIRMPNMDGIELMKYLNNNHPEIKIIILSGYSDVEYLNTAIKNGVAEYLFKPTDIDEFEACFSKLRNKLDEEQRKKEELERIYEQEGDNRIYRQSHYLRQMVKGMKEENEQLNIDFSAYFITIGEIIEENQLDDKGEILTLKNRMVHYCNMRESYYQVHFFLDDYEHIAGIISIPKGIEDWRRFAVKYMQNLQAEILELYQKKLSISISNLHQSKPEISFGYEEAFGCLEEKMLTQPSSIVIYEDRKELNNKEQVRFPTEKIWSYIENCEIELLKESIENVFCHMGQQAYLDHSFVDRICLEFLYDTEEYFRNRRDIALEQLMLEKNKQYKEIYFLKTLKKKQEFIEDILIELAKLWKRQEEQKGYVGNLANYIKSMVDNEYYSNSISLDYIGDKLRKNSSYISKIFKIETGKNFSDYITEKRMMKSKEMLQDYSIKIYEIAEACGYADVSNFIRVFKKYTGLSPKEYRALTTKHMGGQEND